MPTSAPPAPTGPARRYRWALAAALVGYSSFLALVLGWPTPVDAPVGATLRGGLRRLHEFGVPDWVTYGKIEFGANIALFVPVGLLIALALRRGQWWLAVLSGFGLSLLAEVAQGALRPERFASSRDVVANTLGTLVGVGIATVIARRDARGAIGQDAPTSPTERPDAVGQTG
ncbi:VanZ family protein [Pengzhenrongella frigida]|uniref:VanZ family protein n=1 Tax=Pengzhenrongella frigida TaxID=1259133 RepID=A0A4Q5MYD2_9MICO|nr:VanZ family protein [Cellulomonas sp. HLT2-17]RYV49913.1 VanZ family protein [Cellulomonas sp. HLT2-17]